MTYAFDSVDHCTKTVRNLNNPIPTANAITTTLRYDLGSSCEKKGEREVIIVGTVTDRMGAKASFCDPSSNCPSVILSLIPKLEPQKIIDSAMQQIKQNRITSLQAIDELTFAMQARQRQSREETIDDFNSDITEREQEEQVQEVLTVLSMVASAANETLKGDTPQAPRVQGE